MTTVRRAGGLVDIHSHILYGLDDGAKTLEESVAMLQLAGEAGTAEIVATPHANGRYAFDPELIEERIAELAAQVDLRIYAGCDFHLQSDNIEDALSHPEKYTINHNGYLLVEFPESIIFPNTDDILGSFIDVGIVPIVTHPERNAQLQHKLGDIARWVEQGCCVQVTAGSCTGHFGKQAKMCAHELIKRGLTHFVASDGHDCRMRPPILQDAYRCLASDWGEESIRPMFVDNPQSALAGESLAFEFSAGTATGRKWYHFWA